MSAVVALVETMVAATQVERCRIVGPSATNRVVQLSTSNDKKIIGVTLERANAERTVPVQVAGIARVELGGTVNYGDYVKPDANGRGVAAATIPEDFTNREWNAVVGIALASGVAGDIIPVQLQPMVILQP